MSRRKKYTRKVTAWSYGGGVQSVAIGVLIKEGVLPVPDLAAIADTGREKRTTFEYLHEVMQPYLGDLVKIHVIPHSKALQDLYASDGKTILPAFSGVDGGKLATYCSGMWKRDVFERWLRQEGVAEASTWIGYSLDELWRVKNDHRAWCKLEFPLIDKMINRAMCRTLIEKSGLPMPLKSRCYMCPHQSDAEWQEVHDDPEDWQKAIAVDEEIRASDPEQKGLYLYSGRVPLRMAEFGKGIVPPAKPCDSGFCWT